MRQCGTIAVSVSDSGVGMSNRELKEVFSDGVQFNVNALQAGQGSGLGLYIAKGIVEQHGGSLAVTSEGRGCGTTFTMTLPLYTGDDISSSTSHFAGTEQSPTHKSPSCPAKAGHGLPPAEFLRILVVDDAAVNRKLMVRLLKNKGHDCVEAEDGLVAVERVKDSIRSGSLFHSILMDSEMPNMTGPEAAQEIRALGCDTFIVGITGNLFQEDIAHFKSSGANKVLPKPLKLRLLEDIWHDYGVTLGHSSGGMSEKAVNQPKSRKDQPPVGIGPNNAEPR